MYREILRNCPYELCIKYIRLWLYMRGVMVNSFIKGGAWLIFQDTENE